MNERVARTKTQETAWELRKLLKEACPFNDFVVVIREQGGMYELVPLCAFHPLDRDAAKQVVAKFASEARRLPSV